jgi:hypothetical protein
VRRLVVRGTAQRWLARLALCLLAGCLWRGYTAILTVHLDVLTQTAAKLCAVVESGRGLTAEGMAEYVYPAQRARAFLRQFSGQSDRESYRHFSALVGCYERIVAAADAARAAARDGTSTPPDVTAGCAALRPLADVVRADVRREG